MFISIFQVLNEILIIKKIDNEDNTAKVVLANENSKPYPESFWLHVKVLCRLIPWLPVGAVVQVIDESLSSGMDMAHDVVWNRFSFFKIYIQFKFTFIS
jgi:hypothetical protein